MRFPVNVPKIWGKEKDYVNDCLETGWISSAGSYVNAFESALAKLTNRRYCSSVTNGTVALEIALQSLELPKGSEVILPNFTIISALPEVLKLGLKPVFIEPRDYFNVHPEDVLNAITKNTSCIVITHIYCFPVLMQSIIEYAKSKGIRIVEDAAEMLGQTYMGEPIGSFGDISTFSFFANKNITTGEGGAILTNDEGLFRKITKLKNLGFGEPRFIHESFGTNARLTNIQCAIGLGQLENLQHAIDKKRAIASVYNNNLEESIFQITPRHHEGEENIYWVYPVMMKSKELKDRLLSRLRASGIDTRPFFYPLNKQPVLKGTDYFYSGDSFSLDLYNRGFYVPSGLGMELTDFEEIASIMLELSKEL